MIKYGSYKCEAVCVHECEAVCVHVCEAVCVHVCDVSLYKGVSDLQNPNVLLIHL